MTDSPLDEIIEAQGWNDDSVIQLLLQFLEERKLIEACVEFMQSKADEENGEV
jgi:hypothetical protein